MMSTRIVSPTGAEFQTLKPKRQFRQGMIGPVSVTRDMSGLCVNERLKLTRFWHLKVTRL